MSAGGGRRRRRLRGFSLLEVMLASTMLITGITAIIACVHLATRQQEHNRKVGQGLLIAERRMEELLLLFPSSLELSEGRHPQSAFERFSADGRPGGEAFRLSYVVTLATPRDAPPEDRLPGIVLELTVAWDEALGERSLQLRTVR